MALNGISTLSSKELRQIAKLNLAADNRAADSNPRANYDITLLPTRYSGNVAVDNPNTDGLVLGRPWITGILSSIQLEDANGDLLLEDGDLIILED